MRAARRLPRLRDAFAATERVRGRLLRHGARGVGRRRHPARADDGGSGRGSPAPAPRHAHPSVRGLRDGRRVPVRRSQDLLDRRDDRSRRCRARRTSRESPSTLVDPGRRSDRRLARRRAAPHRGRTPSLHDRARLPGRDARHRRPWAVGSLAHVHRGRRVRTPVGPAVPSRPADRRIPPSRGTARRPGRALAALSDDDLRVGDRPPHGRSRRRICTLS